MALRRALSHTRLRVWLKPWGARGRRSPALFECSGSINVNATPNEPRPGIGRGRTTNKAHPKTGFPVLFGYRRLSLDGLPRLKNGYIGLLVFGDIFFFHPQQHDNDRTVGKVRPFGERHFQHQHRNRNHHVNDINRVG